MKRHAHRGGFWGGVHHAFRQGREALGHVDHFLRSHSGVIKRIAQMAAPAIASGGNPALAAGIAAASQGLDDYSKLRANLGV